MFEGTSNMQMHLAEERKMEVMKMGTGKTKASNGTNEEN